MAELTLGTLDELQDITDSLGETIKQAKDDDRIVLSKENAATLLQTINELWDEVTENEASQKSRKPVFLHALQRSQEAYFQPAAIAVVAVDGQGNAVLNMVNGSNLQVEAMQWHMMKKLFHQAVELVEVPSTSGLVKA